MDGVSLNPNTKVCEAKERMRTAAGVVSFNRGLMAFTGLSASFPTQSYCSVCNGRTDAFGGPSSIAGAKSQPPFCSGPPASLLHRFLPWFQGEIEVRAAASVLHHAHLRLSRLVECAPGRLPVAIFQPGQWIAREGERGKEVYMILEGEAEVLRDRNPEDPPPPPNCDPPAYRDYFKVSLSSSVLIIGAGGQAGREVSIVMASNFLLPFGSGKETSQEPQLPPCCFHAAGNDALSCTGGLPCAASLHLCQETK